MSATIKYKGNTIASITTDSTKTLKTSGKYCEGDIVVENVQDGGITPSGNKAITATTSTQTDIDVTNYATVSVAPTPSETKSVTTNGDVTPSSGKLLSKVTVNVPTGTARDSSDLTVSGATVNVPAGLYSSAASKSVASGTAGTPTASKGAVSNNSVTVTPSVTNTAGYITGGTKTGTGVTVSASELVSGNKTLTPSETAQSGIDVTNFKTASVGAISSTYVGSGVSKKAAATVAPSTSEQTVCASGVYTTGEQKVSAITPSIVGNLDASSFAASIVAAIEGKGVDVPSGAKLDALAALIESIEAGGAQMYETDITPAVDVTSDDSSTWITISHNLGVIPRILIIFRTQFVGTVQDEDYLSISYKLNDEWVRAAHIYHKSSTACAYEYNTNGGAITGATVGQNIDMAARTNARDVNESTLDLVGQSGTTSKRLKAGSTYHVVVIA